MRRVKAPGDIFIERLIYKGKVSKEDGERLAKLCRRDCLRYGLKLFSRVTKSKNIMLIRQFHNSVWTEALMDEVNKARDIRQIDPDSEHPIVKYWRDNEILFR